MEDIIMGEKEEINVEASRVYLPISTHNVLEEFDDKQRTFLQKLSDFEKFNGQEQLVVIRTHNLESGQLVTDIDNKDNLKIICPIPTSKEGWETVCRMAWPGIYERLRNDPLFNQNRFESKNPWQAIYNLCETNRTKWLEKGNMISKIVEIPAGTLTEETKDLERLVWPIGTNRNYACILYTSRKKNNNSNSNSNSGDSVISTVYILDISSENIVTAQDTNDFQLWRPKWQKAFLLDNQGSMKKIQNNNRGKKKNNVKHQTVDIQGMVKGCVGLDDSVLFITKKDEQKYAAHLFEIRKMGLIHVITIDLPHKDPSSITCTRSMIAVGYDGDQNTNLKGLYIASKVQAEEWKIHKLSDENIISISPTYNTESEITLMCGIGDEIDPDVRYFNIGQYGSLVDIERIQSIFRNDYLKDDSATYTWRGSLWPSHQECIRMISRSNGAIQGTVRGPCQNVYCTSETTTNDIIIAISSKDSCQISRLSKTYPQLHTRNTVPGIGTAIDLQIYNDIICVHTPENNVLLGNIYKSNFSMDINMHCIGASLHKATFYYKSIQMYYNRIVVLLSTGQVGFYLLK